MMHSLTLRRPEIRVLAAIWRACGFGERTTAVTRQLTVVIERDEDGFLVGHVPSLKRCHSQARSTDDLLARMKEAIELCLEVQGEEADEPLEIVGIRSITV